MLPFKSGMHVLGKHFCGRKQEIKLLGDYIQSAARVYLVGERRIGKSSLILEAIRRQKGCRVLYVDLLAIKTVDDLCKRIVKALISLEQSQSYLLKMMKEFAALRPNVSIDPITSMPSVGLSPTIKLEPDSIDSIMEIVGGLKKTVVVFDEFQDVLQLKERETALALMRGKIQQHSETCYCFAGSVRNNMEEIFTSRTSPFFKSAFALNVGPLDRGEFTRFIRRKFATGNRTIQDEALQAVTDIGCDNPGDIQRLCVALWQITEGGDNITREQLPDALEFVFAIENRAYEDIVEQITGQQMSCLRALAAQGGKAGISGEFVAETGITLSTSVRKAMNRLVEKRILFKREKLYRFCDPFFRAWLLRKNL